MTNISNNGIISIYHGDTFEYPLFINIGTNLEPKRYKLSREDTVYLVITEPNQPFEHALFRRMYTAEHLNDHGDVLISLAPSDTEFLLPGTYYLEAKIKLNNGKTATIIPKRKIFIYD